MSGSSARAAAAPVALPGARPARPVARRRSRRWASRLLRPVLALLGRTAGGVRGTWRRSLRLRVVATTVALSLAVVGLLGTYLVRRIESGLLTAKREAALAEVRTGASDTQQRFDAASDNTDPGELANKQARQLQQTARAAGAQVLLLATPSQVAEPLPSFYVCPPSECRIPSGLQEAVRRQDGQQSWTYSELPSSRTSDLVDSADPGSGQVPALAIGNAISFGDQAYELYYLFPLDREEATLSLVQRTLAVSGLVLVLLVGLIAFVVARQVVTPVRMAARISERLAAGRLEERMLVRGEDDLARLAASFNKMATNLQRQIRQLEDLSRVQRRFVSDVSHELRTPLTTVRMAADVLYEARPEFDPLTARSAELLQTQLDRFESLLTDLLEISRFDAGAAVLEAEGVDLRALATSVVEASEGLAQQRGGTLVLHLPDTPCVAEVDSRRIDRILRNLVVNAIEHGEGRPIDVIVAADERAVAVAVRDHGVGLRPGDGSLVFNRFWRADPARVRTLGGSGLGLSIALEDAHLHGGWLQAWGEPGDGSQFRLTVPYRSGAELDRSPIPFEPTDARRRGRSGRVGGPYRRIPVPERTPTGPA